VKKRAARRARNPRTGEKVFVEEKYVVTFKPGKQMEARVAELDRLATQEAAVSQESSVPKDIANSVPSETESFSPSPGYQSGAGK